MGVPSLFSEKQANTIKRVLCISLMLMALTAGASCQADPPPDTKQPRAVPEQNASQSIPAPSGTVSIQDYRLDQMEKRLDALNKELPDRLDQKAEDIVRWAESTQRSLDSQLSAINIFLAGFAIFVALTGFGVWRWRRRAEDALEEAEKVKKEIEEVAKFCRVTRRDIEKDAEAVAQIAKRDPEKKMTPQERKEVEEVAQDSEATFTSRLMALGLKAEAEEKWQEALKYWEAFVVQNSKDAMANFHLAYCAQQLAEIDLEHKKNLLDKASKHYRAGVQLDPQFALAFNNWGVALSELARLAKGEEKRDLFRRAVEKYERTVQLDPQDAFASCGWGIVLTELARLAKGEERRNLLRRAVKKCERAAQLDPGLASAFSSWGAALAGFASVMKGTELRDPLRRALEKYERATQLDPQLVSAFNNWGYTLIELAKISERAEQRDLLEAALERCERAVQIKPEYALASNNWGYALIELAKLVKGEEQQAFWRQAEEKLRRAEKIEQGSGAYNLARMAALRGDKDGCKEWLEKVPEDRFAYYSSFPEIDHDFDLVREESWFKELLAKFAEK